MRKKMITALCAILTVISLAPTPVHAYDEGKEFIWDDDVRPCLEEGKEIIWDDDEVEEPTYDTRNKVDMIWDIKHDNICYKVTTVNSWNKKKTTTINVFDIDRVVDKGFEVTGYVNRCMYTWAGQNVGVKRIPIFRYVK